MMLPKWLYNNLNNEFHFTMELLDSNQALLNESWQTKTVLCVVNKHLKQWVEKAYRETRKNCTVVLLLPAKTDQFWFHKFAMRGEVRFICGKLSDVQMNISEYSNMLVIFRDHHSHTAKVTSYKKRENQTELFKK